MPSTARVERARSAPIGEVIDARGIRLLGRIERVGPCPVCGGSDRFAVNTRKNLFNCRGCNTGGDVIALVQHLDGVTFAEACAILAGGPVSARSEPRPVIIRPRPASDAEQYERQQRNKARVLFRRAVPAAGTVVETYLKSRAITVPLPPTMRFLAPAGPGYYPAMVVSFGLPGEPEPGVLAIGPDAINAVHLTFLRPDGVGKADTKPNKLTIGSPAGITMVLAPLNDLLGLAICEGIEDALTINQATGLGAWAAGSCVFMPKLVSAIEVSGAECVTIFADSDDAGQRNARQLAEALIAPGIETLVNGLAP